MYVRCDQMVSELQKAGDVEVCTVRLHRPSQQYLRYREAPHPHTLNFSGREWWGGYRWWGSTKV